LELCGSRFRWDEKSKSLAQTVQLRKGFSTAVVLRCREA
jgi:hypothetical protein